jgi:MOSC domain-containing protein YiiM
VTPNWHHAEVSSSPGSPLGPLGPSLVSVNVGRPETGPWTGRVGRTAIRKLPVPDAVAVGAEGLDGDSVCDRKFHGGSDQAVYVYAREDLDHWAALLGRPVPAGQFGENLTTRGLDVNAALVGERWRVGTVLLEVVRVRIPCRVFANFMGLTGYDHAAWIKRFTAEGRPGPYLRVLEPGSVRTGDPVVVEHVPAHGVTVATLFRGATTDRALGRELLGVPDLPAGARRQLGEKLGPVAAGAADPVAVGHERPQTGVAVPG